MRFAIVFVGAVAVAACGGADDAALVGSGGSGGATGGSGGAAGTGVDGGSGAGGRAGGGGSTGGTGGLDGGAGGDGGPDGGAGAGGSGGTAGAAGAAGAGGTGAVTAAGTAPCGTAPCALDQNYCCLGEGNPPVCTPDADDCPCQGILCDTVRIECDGAEDCGAGEVCCAERGITSQTWERLFCTATCANGITSQARVACNGQAPCPTGTCTVDPALPPGYGTCR